MLSYDHFYDSGSSSASSMVSHDHYYPIHHYELENEFLDAPKQQQQRVKRKYRTRPKSPNTVQESKVRRRKRANSRERKRMQSLNDALETLRQSLPQGSKNDEQKMTKIETLKTALNYIHDLSEALQQNPGHPMPNVQ
ncbi:hypothetical protein L596_024819 [Steinernema carpocapsae]|uniref:BHLH domain-containing protein n=1 Tax=Steinernema carpocapsae TaxID=34508 RepID=A0A4U5M5V8_STECR|nr:hypothetical protein L596_024819 [Steinernema carpocapsae]